MYTASIDSVTASIDVRIHHNNVNNFDLLSKINKKLKHTPYKFDVMSFPIPSQSSILILRTPHVAINTTFPSMKQSQRKHKTAKL